MSSKSKKISWKDVSPIKKSPNSTSPRISRNTEVVDEASSSRSRSPSMSPRQKSAPKEESSSSRSRSRSRSPSLEDSSSRSRSPSPSPPRSRMSSKAASASASTSASRKMSPIPYPMSKMKSPPRSNISIADMEMGMQSGGLSPRSSEARVMSGNLSSSSASASPRSRRSTASTMTKKSKTASMSQQERARLAAKRYSQAMGGNSGVLVGASRPRRIDSMVMVRFVNALYSAARGGELNVMIGGRKYVSNLPACDRTDYVRVNISGDMTEMGVETQIMVEDQEGNQLHQGTLHFMDQHRYTLVVHKVRGNANVTSFKDQKQTRMQGKSWFRFINAFDSKEIPMILLGVNRIAYANEAVMLAGRALASEDTYTELPIRMAEILEVSAITVGSETVIHPRVPVSLREQYVYDFILTGDDSKPILMYYRSDTEVVVG